MKVTNGFSWIGTCTAPFEETMAFFRDILGLTVTGEGIPWIDKRFTRYVQFTLSDSQIFEIVDGPPDIRKLYNAPIIAFRVDDLSEARREMESKGVELLGPVLQPREGWGWMHFRSPDGYVYQLSGPYKK